MEVVDECRFCRTEMRLLCENALGMTMTPDAPMRVLSIDHVYLPESTSGNAFALTILDIWSKHFIAVPVPDLTMANVLIVLRTYLGVFSTVNTVRADNAFNTASINELCDMFNIRLKFYASHNSKSSNVERYHTTFREKLETFRAVSQLEEDEWDRVCHLAVKAMNDTVHTTTGYTPYELVFNTSPNFEGLPESVSQSETDRRRIVTDRLIKSKAKYVSNKPIPRLEPGTLVNVRYGSKNKSKPFEAVVVEDDGSPVLTVARKGERATRHNTIRIRKSHIWVPTSSVVSPEQLV